MHDAPLEGYWAPDPSRSLLIEPRSVLFQGFDHKLLAGSVISRVASRFLDFELINTIFGRFRGLFMIEIDLI